MNTTVVILEILIMIVLFTVMTLGLLCINPLSFISDYPPEIQNAYYESQHKQATKERLTTLMVIKKSAAVVVFTLILAWMLHAAGCQTFGQGLCYAYFLILVLFSWDTFVLDWFVFPNLKRARLPGTEHMDKEYRQKWFHVKACFPVIPVFVMMGIICSFLMTRIW